MRIRKFILNNPQGLHYRPVTALVEAIANYEADVNIYNLDNGQVADGRSIISTLMLNAPQGTRIKIEVDGKDEDKLFDLLCDIIENKFYDY